MLNADIEDQKKVAKTISEAKREGIKFLPPQLDILSDRFNPTTEGIQIPLNYIKGVGKEVIPHLKELSPIKSLEDLWERRTKKYANKGVVTNMIKAGCFDFEADKEEMIYRFQCLQRNKTQIKNEIFPERKTYKEEDFIRMEREALGMNLTAHPLEKWNYKNFWNYDDGSIINVTGLIKEVSTTLDKNANKMAFLQVELPSGVHKGLIFSSSMKKLFSENMEEKIYHINGRRSGDSIIINDMKLREDIKI